MAQVETPALQRRNSFYFAEKAVARARASSPSNTKTHHALWPSYTGVGTTLTFDLATQAYKAKVLSENTILAFYPAPGDRNLTPQQTEARRHVVALYQRLSVVADSDGDPKSQDLRPFFKALDQFFFGGSLTRGVVPRALLSVCYVEGSPHSRTQSLSSERLLGMSRYMRASTRPNVWIFIAGKPFGNPDVNTKNYRLNTLLGVLLHEMVHAYMDCFICTCGDCSRDFLNICGVKGHGRVFQQLFDCVLSTIGTWHPDLDIDRMNEGVRAGGRDEVVLLQGTEDEAYKDWVEAGGHVDALRPRTKAAVYRRGDRVYQSEIRVGGTWVDPERLDITGDAVQRLSNRHAARQAETGPLGLGKIRSLPGVRRLKRSVSYQGYALKNELAKVGYEVVSCPRRGLRTLSYKMDICQIRFNTRSVCL
ncbi:Uu.00g032640.m01.CDS01 [Anthostomella pinea]|uniref:Uu.00g032640.m01.CDS01 n=1 Tax=Anthostomella pinea TaxID=933095 RepID=A0AAI8V9R4_9PEZI|nr:Uu.00g032640.m01.CDS01 [Anthostomella pinea]